MRMVARHRQRGLAVKPKFLRQFRAVDWTKVREDFVGGLEGPSHTGAEKTKHRGFQLGQPPGGGVDKLGIIDEQVITNGPKFGP
jgi:hypothetical protein